MKLFPQHLRDRQHGTVIRRRTYGLRGKGDYAGTNVESTPLPPPKIGKLGRLWLKGSGLTEKQAATGLPAASMSTMGTVWCAPTIAGGVALLISGISLAKHGVVEPLAISAAATAVLTYLSAVPWAKMAFQWCYKEPLAEGEIEQLLENENTATEIEQAYLRLVRDAVRQTAEVGPETEAEVQAAIASLGEAIDRLPAVSVTPVDTVALRHEAETLQADALTNPDRVIGESLERRADALIRRADANDRSGLAVRRTAALRAEIEAQIAALREGIATLGTGYGTSDSATSENLQHLSESARRLAAEAVSAASARAELDGGNLDKWLAVSAEKVEPVRVRVGASSRG
ncbi:MAG: hypothetical protein H7145_21985 [Akkermansiaceae bacterium]|nr:hypothetical protein [Armatimonadota bacterium]